jgi:secreted trypsin-like serine protease
MMKFQIAVATLAFAVGTFNPICKASSADSALGELGRFANLPGFSNSIIGGDTVAAGDVIGTTTVGLLAKVMGGTALCTGSLIDKDLIVTAGHCVPSKPSNLKIVFARDILGASSGSIVSPKGFVRHPNYDSAVNDQDMNDIALVRFEGGLPAGYAAATLLEDRGDLRDGGDVTLAGYGITSGNQSDNSHGKAGILRKVDTTIVKAQYGKSEVSLDQTKGHGACHGDSGGPAFIRNESGKLRLFGVTSRGPEDMPDDCASTAIYTNILAHKDFLKKAAAQLRAQTE